MSRRFWQTVMAVAALVLGARCVQAQTTVQYYHTDAIGSVRLITNQAGAVVAYHDYVPFGTESPLAAVSDPRLFAGQERDVETGFDYLGARYFSPAIGRFTRPDDPGYADPGNPQSWNLYTYAFNNPLRYVDPDGHSGDCVAGYDAATGLCEPASPDLGLMQFLFNSLFQNPFAQTNQQTNTGMPSNLPIGTPQQFWNPFRQGFGTAKHALQNPKCGAFYGGQGSAAMDATQYRFLDLNNPAVGAATLSQASVLINSKGAYMTYTPSSGQAGPFGRFWTQGDFRGFILLHELGHQLSSQTGFGADAANARLNTAQSRQVLSRCF